jgi:hypothetical protein
LELDHVQPPSINNIDYLNTAVLIVIGFARMGEWENGRMSDELKLNFELSVAEDAKHRHPKGNA